MKTNFINTKYTFIWYKFYNFKQAKRQTTKNIGNILRKGPYKAVKLVKDKKTNEKIYFENIYIKLELNYSLKKSFCAEIEILKIIDHKNIGKLIEFIKDDEKNINI